MITLPPLLFSIARNPVTAVGLPFIGGMISGSPTRRVVKGKWYNVCNNLATKYKITEVEADVLTIVWGRL